MKTGPTRRSFGAALRRRLPRAWVPAATALAVLVIGVLALDSVRDAQRSLEGHQRADRLNNETRAVADLEIGLLQSFRGTLDAAGDHAWSLAPDDAGDAHALEATVARLRSFGYVGGSVLDMRMQARTTYSSGPPIPALSHPAFTPMLASLAAGRADPSDLIEAGGTPLVGFPAPIIDATSSAPRGVLVLFIDLTRSAFAESQQARAEQTGAAAAAVDRRGAVVAASEPALVGRPWPQGEALESLLAGGSGFSEVERDGRRLVTSFSPSSAGWGVISEQPASEFYGEVRSSVNRTRIDLMAALALAVVGISFLGQRQWSALERLARQSHVDALTGLPNRALFLERLVASRRAGSPTAVLFVDLDDFKEVNDTLGHRVGDELLGLVASRLANCVRPDDVLARLGGDEFAVLVAGGDASGAGTLAERLVDALAAPFTVAGQRVHVAASVGIALGDTSHDGGTDLLRDADVAMYQAKAAGKGRVAYYDEAMRDALVRRAKAEADIQMALERQELVLYYQPIVEVSTGRTVGAEALVRWEHPTLGLLPPSDIIPAAERSGSIVALGEWALREGCRQAAEWRRSLPDTPFAVSVNVSARQLEDPSLVNTVAVALAAAGLDPSGLCLEITESAVLTNPEAAAETVRAIKNLGVWLAIDDFGTGYASLTYLRRLKADRVKIDRSFVDGLGSEIEDTTIVASVIGLAHSMGMTVTAEGVETAEQLFVLGEMGCEQAQGFYLCPPVPASELSGRLDRDWIGEGDGAEPGRRAADVIPLLRAVPATSRDRYRVVLADDNSDDRFLQRRELESSGRFEVVGEASDGEQAVRLAATRQPHIVLLDLRMPVCDGLTALPRILMAAPGTKVVLLSGQASPGAVDRALSVGATAFHRKGTPNLAGELVRLLDAA